MIFNPALRKIDESYLPYCTEADQRYLEAYLRLKSDRRVAKELGVNKNAVHQAMSRLIKRAAYSGHAPAQDMIHPVPEGYKVKGVSTYYNEDGKPTGQWVKSQLDEEKRLEFVKEAIRSLSEECRGLSPAVQGPKSVNADLLAVYPFGDPHFGMYAWAQETGEDFDLNIAKRLTLGAVDRLVQAAPPAETAILLLLGDVFHMDDQTNLTPGHKHQLDADGRFVKVLEVGIQTFRHAVLRALEKHQKVIVRCVPGNHDPHSIWSLAFTLSAYFDHEPRVTVDLTPSAFWYYRFGKVLIGSTHGDKTKPEQLLGVMASDRAEDWGETKHRYWYTGHIHTQTVREFQGVTTESFRTLAAKDAYTAGHGYRAGRDMRCIVHSREHGEIERHRCDIGMIEM